MDGLFYVLISFLTFFSGIMVSQYRLVTEYHLISPFIGLILSLVLSFTKGLSGMISDTVKDRIWSWSYLILAAFYFLTNCIVATTQPWIIDKLGSWSSATGLVIGMIVGGFSLVVNPRIILRLKAKLDNLLGQEILLDTKTLNRSIFFSVFIIILTALFLSIFLDYFLTYF